MRHTQRDRSEDPGVKIDGADFAPARQIVVDRKYKGHISLKDYRVLLDTLTAAQTEIEQLRAENAELRQTANALPQSIQEALNSGDGVYRP